MYIIVPLLMQGSDSGKHCCPTPKIWRTTHDTKHRRAIYGALCSTTTALYALYAIRSINRRQLISQEIYILRLFAASRLRFAHSEGLSLFPCIRVATSAIGAYLLLIQMASTLHHNPYTHFRTLILLRKELSAFSRPFLLPRVRT